MDIDLVDFMRRKDHVAEIVVRVDSVQEPREFGDAKIVYFKFIVANEKALRIQCMALEDQIERIRPLVKRNTIICIKGATSKKETNPKYNDGDVPFVLMIYSNTVITLIKDYDPDDDNEDNSKFSFANEASNSSLNRLIDRYELDHITTVIDNNTAAMRELTAALREGRLLK